MMKPLSSTSSEAVEESELDTVSSKNKRLQKKKNGFATASYTSYLLSH